MTLVLHDGIYANTDQNNDIRWTRSRIRDRDRPYYNGLTLGDAKDMIKELILSSDNDVLEKFWLEIAHISLGEEYISDELIEIIEKCYNQKMTQYDYDRLRLLLITKWRYLYNNDCITKFFNFLAELEGGIDNEY